MAIPCLPRHLPILESARHRRRPIFAMQLAIQEIGFGEDMTIFNYAIFEHDLRPDPAPSAGLQSLISMTDGTAAQALRIKVTVCEGSLDQIQSWAATLPLLFHHRCFENIDHNGLRGLFTAIANDVRAIRAIAQSIARAGNLNHAGHFNL